MVHREWFIGNELPTGEQIALQLSDLTLLALDRSTDIRAEIPLAGSSKQEVFEQLKQQLADLDVNVGPLINELHYSLPEHELDTHAAFRMGDPASIRENILYRHNAGMVNEPYYYLSYWTEDPVEDFNALPDPETGEWIRTGWQGGVARHGGIVKSPSADGQFAYVESFFRSGIKLPMDHYNL